VGCKDGVRDGYEDRRKDDESLCELIVGVYPKIDYCQGYEGDKVGEKKINLHEEDEKGVHLEYLLVL
jgi:hypothetical protein